MKRFIEELEDRTLTSATPLTLFVDQLKLAADSRATVLALRQIRPALFVDFKNIRTDFRALPKTTTNIALLTTLFIHANQSAVTLMVDYSKLTVISWRMMRNVMIDGFKLRLRPTDATLQAKLSADLAAFPAAISAAADKFASDMTLAGQTLAADAAALVTANPTATQLATDLQQLQTHATTAFSNVQVTLASSQPDLAQFVTDLTT